MALSGRGQDWANSAPDLTIWSVIKNLWDPESNPGGYVSLGVAENGLMHDELSQYINKHVKLPSNGLTYGDGGTGMRTTQAAMARFLTRTLKPVLPLEPAHVCITNGVSSGIEHLSNILADQGDVFLLGQPHYGAFIPDIAERPGTRVVPVSFGDIHPLSTQALAAYEKAIMTCQASSQNVKAIMLCNPHNPLGQCYPKDNIHLISDEIYSNSVWKHSDPFDSSVVPFTSAASIPTKGLINPALVHILYGISKDFGANGLRVACIISQRNTELHQALIPVAIYSYASSLAESITTTLLSDDNYVDWYLEENRRRLRQNYDIVGSWAQRHGIEYSKGGNAAFFLWANLGDTYLKAVEEGRLKSRKADDLAQQPTESVKSIDTRVMNALMEEKLFLASGSVFGSEKPGWFRIAFAQKEQILMEGLRRTERALGLIE